MSFEVFKEGGDAEHRLESNEVHDVFVDSQNRIWFSTDQGLSMKDGSNDVVWFDDFWGIPNRFCRVVRELNNKIYVGTWGGGAAVWSGLVPIDQTAPVDTAWAPMSVDMAGDTGLVDTRVSAMVSDGTSLWIGTVNGVSEYTPGLPDTLAWSNQTSKMTFSRAVSRMLFQPATSRGDEVWIATKDGGITVVRAASSTRYTAGTTSLPQNDVNGLAYSTLSGLFWTGMATQCVASADVDAAIWTHLTTVEGFASNLVTGLAAKDDGGVDELWVATQTGLSVMRDGEIYNYIKGSGLPSERLRNVIIDRNGEIWACFINAGAGRVRSYELRN